MSQALLMGTCTSMMGALGLECAQVLLTQHNFICSQRYGRLTATLELFSLRGIIPTINKNNVVTGGTELNSPEVAFSNNDMLSTLVAAGLRVDAVAMMTVKAVFDKPQRLTRSASKCLTGTHKKSRLTTSPRVDEVAWPQRSV